MYKLKPSRFAGLLRKCASGRMIILQKSFQCPYECGNYGAHSKLQWDFVPCLCTKAEETPLENYGFNLEYLDLFLSISFFIGGPPAGGLTGEILLHFLMTSSRNHSCLLVGLKFVIWYKKISKNCCRPCCFISV